MTTERGDRSEKPSAIDLITDPDKFDRWQRQREREEVADDRTADGRQVTDRQEQPRQPEEPRERASDR